MPDDVRWASASGGRSRVVARGAQVFAVANASDARLDGGLLVEIMTVAFR